MKIKIILSVLVLAVIASAYGQTLTINLTFAINNVAYVRLDSIKVMNRTQGGDTVIYWPDTTLTLKITQGDLLLYIGYSKGYPLGIREPSQTTEDFQVFQNYPNPVKDQSFLSIYVPEKGTVDIMVADVQGRVVIATEWHLDQGNHSFRFDPGSGTVFFLTAQWKRISRSIKILSTGSNSGNSCTMEYIGMNDTKNILKTSSLKTGLVMQESGILDAPAANKTYTFQFATNIPCPGTPTVVYEGQTYNTIQIFSQCWLKENLNVGTMINNDQDQTNNGIIEKYCYNNSPDSCNKYGGLYKWDEMMQYTSQQGVQGICPPGWHLPTNEEWKVLEGAVDSKYRIGDGIWESYGTCGLDAGTNLKTTSGWYDNGQGTDLFSFSGLPGGYSCYNIDFYNIGLIGYWWTSSVWDYYISWDRSLYYNYPEAMHYYDNVLYDYSVRCLRNY